MAHHSSDQVTRTLYRNEMGIRGCEAKHQMYVQSCLESQLENSINSSFAQALNTWLVGVSPDVTDSPGRRQYFVNATPAIVVMNVVIF